MRTKNDVNECNCSMRPTLIVIFCLIRLLLTVLRSVEWNTVRLLPHPSNTSRSDANIYVVMNKSNKYALTIYMLVYPIVCSRIKRFTLCIHDTKINLYLVYLST